MKRLATVALTFAIATAAHAAANIKLATLVPKRTSFHIALQQMGEQWRHAPGGGVGLTIYTDGTMGSEADVVKRMRSGQIHAALLTVAGLAEIDPGVTALQEMPMMFRDLAEVEYVGERLRPLLADRMRKKGFVVLFWADSGWVRFFSRSAVMTPGDLKKQKLFTVANDNKQIDVMKRLGYAPVPLEFSDALTSLRTGMIDAIPAPPFFALSGQFYTVAKHMSDVPWVPLVGALVIRSDTWDAVPPATRDALAKAAMIAGAQIQQRGRADSDQAVKQMQQRNLVVHVLTPQQRGEWEQAARQAYPYIRGAIVPVDVFDQVQKLLAERRATAAGGGR